MSVKVPAVAYSFLSGGGEMGELTRKKDWGKTIVGEVSNWPQSLKTTIGIILNSKFPMFLFWGEALTCFYNDAYRPSLGNNGKHPAILGMPGQDAWPEIWHIIKPLIHQIMAGGEATWSEDQLIPIYRNGKIENVYWTFSYSPVKDESGTVAGVFVTCVESTAVIINRQKLEESKDQLQFAIEAAELGTWDYNPVAGTFTGNDRLKEWFGLHIKDEIELPLAISVMHEDDRERVTLAIQKALQYVSGGLYDISYTIVHPATATQTTVRAKGRAWFDENKTACRFNGILQDITEQHHAEQALLKVLDKIKESEKDFRELADSLPVLVWTTDAAGKQLFASKRWKEFTGLDPADETTFAAIAHSDDFENVIKIWTNCIQSGNIYKTELRIKNKNNGYEWFIANGQPTRNENGQIEKWVGAFTNVNEQKLIENKLTAVLHRVGESEQRFQAAIKAIHGILWTNNAAGEMEGEQSGWGELTGQSYEAYQGYGWATAVHPDDGQPTIVAWEEAVREKKNFIFEHRVKKKNGEFGFFSIRAIPVFDQSGAIIEWVGVHTDITHQKKTEQEIITAFSKIEESEKRFRNVADSAPVLVWMAGTDKLCSYFNKAWLRFTGRTMEEETGNGWLNGIHPDDFQRCLDEYADSFEKRKEFYIEYRLKRHDGAYRWISNNGVPRFTLEGSFEGYIGACMDIHERVMYQSYLEDSEERLNIVIDASELGTWELDLKTKEALFSERYMQIFGYDKKIVLTYEQLLIHLYPDDLIVREKAWEKAMQSGYLYYQARIIWKDASLHWIEAKGKVFYDDENKPLKMVGTIRDITDEKKYQQDLEESEQKFRLLADSMPQFIWTGDPAGNLNYFNKTVYKYSGLSVNDVEINGWLQIVHPDDREENIKQWTQAIQSGEPFLFEHRFRRYDGEYRWQLSRAIPQKDEKGNIQMWVGTSTDIDQIKKHDQQKDDFIKMASHELKTPVTTIKGYVQLLLKMNSREKDPFLASSLLTIDKQVFKLTKLITDLLDVTKIETGSLELNKEKFFIAGMVKELARDLETTTQTHRIAVRQHADPLVYADKDRIAQVFINLFTNAIKYSPKAHEIIIDINMQENNIIIAVKDFGIGISQEDLSRIFERFYRAAGKDEKTFPGFGIGLFIVNEIVSLHNGKIWVESEKEKGSVFYVSLPAGR